MLTVMVTKEECQLIAYFVLSVELITTGVDEIAERILVIEAVDESAPCLQATYRIVLQIRCSKLAHAGIELDYESPMRLEDTSFDQIPHKMVVELLDCFAAASFSLSNILVVQLCILVSGKPSNKTILPLRHFHR